MFGTKPRLANYHEIKNSLNSLVIEEFKNLSALIICIISTVLQIDAKSMLTPDIDKTNEKPKLAPTALPVDSDIYYSYSSSYDRYSSYKLVVNFLFSTSNKAMLLKF